MSTRHADATPLVEPTDTDMSAFVAQFREPGELPSPPGRDHGSVALRFLQPHPDDCALSIGGLLARVANPLQMITVYSEAATPAESVDRKAEDRRFTEAIGATWHSLGHDQRTSLSAPPASDEVDALVTELAGRLDPGGLLLAPAGVARHVDHLAVHDAARRLGAAAFWEDVAFWSIYAASVEDRVQFSIRNADWLADYVLVAVDISGSVRHKAALVACYRSQSVEFWRPLRYGWAAAGELGRGGYCERLFVRCDRVDDVARALGLEVADGPLLQYGTVPVRTAWATTSGGAR